MNLVADLLAVLCLAGGALLSLAAGVGVLRFPDVLARIHAATKPQVLGVLLVLFAVALRLHSGTQLAMVLLAALLQLVTIPVSAQMIGRAAYRSGNLRRDLLERDDLA